MVETGHITMFREIFNYVAKSVVANELNTNYSRLNRLIEVPEDFTLREVFRIGVIIGLDEKKMLDLVYNQYMHYKHNFFKK